MYMCKKKEKRENMMQMIDICIPYTKINFNFVPKKMRE